MSEQKVPTLLDVAKSVLASFFGVQSDRNRERDFNQGRPGHYIIVGLVFTVLFVLALWGVVELVLLLAGG